MACLGEPLSAVVYAAQVVTGRIQMGDVVAVVGAGFAGQVIAQGAKKDGADELAVMDLVDEKLELAKSLGTDVTINVRREDPIQVLMELTDGRGVDVVVEASGSGEGLNTASAVVRHNGMICIYSHYIKPFMVDVYRWHEDCLNIVHTCLTHRTREETVVGVREAFRLIKKGEFVVKPLLNRIYRLSEVGDAFRKEMEDETSVKSIIIP